MQVSIIGLGVCAAVYLFGYLFRSPLIVGLISSLAFGTTSVVTLSALGGSSPLIYLVFAGAFVASVAADRRFVPALLLAFRQTWVAWAICAVAAYAAGSAYIMPRLFAGMTNAFVTAREKGVAEVSLVPNSGNITQTGYFILGALTALAFLTLDRKAGALAAIAKGFMCWAGITAAAGLIDLGAKTVGAGDVFDPIRTASFSLLTQDEQAGFSRINGLFSEASSFAATSLAAMAFTFTMWRHGGSRLALGIAVTLLVLLVLSTSTTAYAGLALLILPVCASLILSWARNRMGMDVFVIVLGIVCGVTVGLGIVVFDQHLLEPFQKLLQTSIFDKAQSESGRERAHWNQRSLETLFDTWGLGVGFGSSRASNWLVAVLSQCGILGTAMQLCLLLPFLCRPRRPDRATPADQIWVLHSGLRACALVWLLGGIISGGSADPGLLFFVALAGTIMCQKELASSERVKSPRPTPRLPVVRPPQAPGQPTAGPGSRAAGRLTPSVVKNFATPKGP